MTQNCHILALCCERCFMAPWKILNTDAFSFAYLQIIFRIVRLYVMPVFFCLGYSSYISIPIDRVDVQGLLTSGLVVVS